MKITNLSIEKRENEGDPALVCLVTFEDGSQTQCHHMWRNTRGMWASPDDAREPAEISAALQCFAKAIDDQQSSSVMGLTSSSSTRS